MSKFTSLMSIMMFFVMIFIIFMIIMNSIHPIFLIILIMIYTLMICLTMSMWSYNYMYSIMTFLIMISGLLIIFLYFASLISNELNKISWPPLILFNMLLNFIISTLFFFNYQISMPLSLHPYLSLETAPLTNLNSNTFHNIIKIFIYPSNNLTLMAMCYLLFALFTIIKICSSKSTSLRKIN